jgi:outer membrane receptor protein involved in Fe transport
LVNRVETIAIGGAPIYGSDAIAGTVNVILKRDYHGIDLDAQYGISQWNDAANWRIRGLAGTNFADGRGNVTIAGEYNRGKGILYNDRPLTRLGRFYGDCPAGSPFNQCLYDNRRIPSISESGIITVSELFGFGFPLSPDQSNLIFEDPTVTSVVTDGAGNQLQLSPNGTTFIPINFGTPVGGPTDFNIDFSGGNGFNLFNTQQLLTDTQRWNANILAQFKVSDSIRVFGEGWYAHSKGTNLREQPVYNSELFDAAGTPDGPIILSINNPFLTPDQRATIQNSIDNGYSDQNLFGGSQDYFYLQRANTDIISGRASSSTNLYRGVLGVDGSFPVGARQWNWEVVGNYGVSTTKGHEPVLVQQNFENAVGAITADNPNGVPCLAGLANSPMPTLNSTCAPLNLFGQNQMSRAALDYITAIADPEGTNKEFVATASLTGGLFSLPGGDLSFALGAEHRHESTEFKPGQFFFGGPDPDPTTDTDGDGDPTNDRVQYGRSIPIFPVKGSYHTNEVFGEIRAPIVRPSNSVRGIYNLELHGAARFVDHSTAGGAWTYTAEGRWGIVKDIAFRANYTHAIRAPAITEVFNPSSLFFGFAVDPCDADNLTSGPDPAARQANCAAAGLLPNFQSLSNQRSFHQSLIGNVDLKNEKSNAWSIGTVLTPRFIPGLTISADYLNIKLRDAITSFSGTDVVNACYDAPDFPNNDFCPRITRDGSGQLSFIQTSYFNAAEYQYKGALVALDYSHTTPFLGAGSEIGINLQYQYLKSLTQKASGDAAPTHLGGMIGYPHHSAVLNVNYQRGPLGLFTSFNYTGKSEIDPDAAPNFYDTPTRDAVLFVNSGLSFDLAKGAGTKGLGKGAAFRFVVDNVFNAKPPYPSPAGGGVVTYFPGILGRYYRAGVSVHF